MQKLVQVRGTEFIWEGAPLRLRGFGVGTWLNMEHFMLGWPTPDSMIRACAAQAYGQANAEAFFQHFGDCFLRREDMAFLKSCGVNFIRVPFNHRLLMDDATGEYREAGFARLTQLMDLCEEYEIFCMPDLHTTPGGQNPDWHSDNRTGTPQFWEFKVFRDAVVRLWGEIARRLAGYPHLLGYDLLNEPAMAAWPALNSFYADAIACIRQHDPDHIILLEGDGFAMDFSGLERFEAETQLALTFHYYPTVWHPDLLARTMPRAQRKEKLEAGLVRLVQLRQQFGRPVICGEAGYDLDPEDMTFCMDLLEDTLELFEKHQVSWALWAYKDACFMGMVHPKRTGGWMRLAGQLGKSWSHYGEMEQARQTVAEMARPFGGVSEELAYKAQFRVRGILYTFQQEKLLLPAFQALPWEEMRQLPEDFLFENCEAYPEYVALIRRFTAQG